MLSDIYISSTLSSILVSDTLVLTTHDLRKNLHGVQLVFYSFSAISILDFFIATAMFLGSVLSEQLAHIC